MEFEGEKLFEPEWGTFDMACGNSEILSVFGGAADRGAYIEEAGNDHVLVREQKQNRSEANEDVLPLYQKLRDMRELESVKLPELDNVFQQLQNSFPNDWLLRMELLELYQQQDGQQEKVDALTEQLNSLKNESSVLTKLVDRGLKILLN